MLICILCYVFFIAVSLVIFHQWSRMNHHYDEQEDMEMKRLTQKEKNRQALICYPQVGH